MRPLTANRRGILALVLATACFAGNDAIVKLVTRAVPLGEVLFVRGLITTALVGLILLLMGHGPDLRWSKDPLVLSRSVCEALTSLFFTTALMHMPLGELSAVVLVAPLVLTSLSVLLFGELVGWRRWSAIVVGFFGALCVTKPVPAEFNWWALLGLLVAVSSASRDLITRRLPAGIPSILVSFTAAVAVTAAGAILGVGESWRSLHSQELLLLTLAAVLLAGANFLVVVAFRGVEIATVAPFRYSVLVWAGLLGFLVFGERPDLWSATGAALIVGSGLYALHREAVRSRAARPNPA